MIINIAQRSDEWKALRKTKITGTDAGIIIGVNPYKTPYKLWQQKLDQIEEDFVNDKMKQGTDLETYAKQEYEKAVKMAMEASVHISDVYDWQMCSTDGITFDGEIILEIKCGQRALEKCTQNEIPPYYYAQIQHNLCVTGAKECHYFCYYPLLGHAMQIVKRDEEYIRTLIQKEQEFYKCLVEKIPPEASEDEHIIVNDIDFVSAAEAWKLANAKLKIAEAEEKRTRDALIDLTDDSNVAGAGIKMTRVSRTVVDYKKAVEDNRIDIAPYTKQGIGYYKITLDKCK